MDIDFSSQVVLKSPYPAVWIVEVPQNYIPFAGRSGPFPAVLSTTVGPSLPLSGLGAPEGVVPGCPGQTYRDLNNDDQWLKMIGTQETGWRRVGTYDSGNAGGVQRVWFGTASNPNNVQIAIGPSVYFGANGSVWIMPSGISGNTGWQAVIVGT